MDLNRFCGLTTMGCAEMLLRDYLPNNPASFNAAGSAALGIAFQFPAGSSDRLFWKNVRADVAELRADFEASPNDPEGRIYGDVWNNVEHGFLIIWPERRRVSAQQIETWFADAVANGDIESAILVDNADKISTNDKALALDGAGIITLCRGGGETTEDALRKAGCEV